MKPAILFPRLFILCVLLLFLHGCVSETKPEFDSTRLKPGQGIIFLSVVRQKIPLWAPSTVYLSFTNESGDRRGLVWFPGRGLGIGPGFPSNDGREMVGLIQAYTLPAGRYHLNNFRIAEAIGTTAKFWRARRDFSIPFKVTPGKATYLGEIEAIAVSGKNPFGMETLAGGTFRISSKPGRDIPLFRQ